MRDSKVVEWGVRASNAQYTLYKSDNLYNSVDIQKSNKVLGYSTSFYLDDGTWLRSIIDAAGAWGEGNTSLGGGEVKLPLPNKVRVTYFDDITNQYYQGEHSLPTDEIYALMTDTSKKMLDTLPKYEDFMRRNYSDIELAFTPDGWIIVFVTGLAGRKEVASFQATPIEPDPKTLEGDPLGSTDEYLLATYQTYLEAKKTGIPLGLQNLKEQHPQAYEQWKSGKWLITPDWYKKIQTKYPWNLSVTIDEHQWNGEYYAKLINTEEFAVLDGQFDRYRTQLKTLPDLIRTWVTDNNTGLRTELEVHLYPRPKWSTLGIGYYKSYYQDPNLDFFFKRFEYLYPNRSLKTNKQPALDKDFATLQLHFDKNLVLQDAYIQKGSQKLPLEGAYQFSISPIDEDFGQYQGKIHSPVFITEPKLKDLSDPVFVDLD